MINPVSENPRSTPTRRPKTLLQRFLDEHGIASAKVGREAGFSRQTLARWRLGRVDIRRKHMVRILGAIRRVSGQQVRMEEIFDLDPENPDNWTD